MKNTVFATAALAALIGTPATAADMATNARPPLLADWAGFYLGANAGGGFAIANVYDPDCFFCNDSTLHGGFGEIGGQAGYNWQFGHAVVGIEGDLNWQSFDRNSGVVATVEVTKTKLDAFASLRLRAGLALDGTLAYVTFGPAWGHANSVSTQFTNTSLTTIAEQAIDRGWHGGIATGAGVEYKLAPNWAVRGEYLYVDYTDAVNFLVPTTQGRKDYGYSEQIARVGLNYFFNGGAAFTASSATPILGKAHLASFPTTAAGWDGFYIGGNVGGGIAEAQLLDPDCFLCGSTVDHRAFAALGGQAGYDAQWNAIVLGIIGDIDWASAKENQVELHQFEVGRLGGTNHFQIDALASLRARVGLATDRSLFYVTAGPAWGRFNSLTTVFTTPALTTARDMAADNGWHLGLATGAGMEFALDPHWSLFGEYLYYSFGSKSAFFQPTAVGSASDVRNRIDYAYSAQIGRVGLNYSFNGRGPAAVGTRQYFKAPVSTSWAGFYVGANAGGGLANGQAMDVDLFTGSDMNFHTAFAAFGGQAGYNWQRGLAVFGLEADMDWSSASSSRAVGLDNTPPFGPATERYKMDGFASLRARAGLALERSLLYVTAGPAIGHFKENVVATDGSFISPWTGWAPGLAAGGGFAYRLDAHWSLRAEFLHLAFADKIVNCNPGTVIAAQNGCGSVVHTQYANSAELARIGLDYTFDWVAIGKAPPPLLSKN